MATLAEQLAEAQNAYHQLQIGKAVAVVRDQSGEEIRYTQANRADLKVYIGDLQSQIAAIASPSVPPIGPMRLLF